MKKAATPLKETLKNFLPLREYFVKYRRGLAVGLLSLLAVDFLQLLIPLVIRKAIDELTAGGATSDALFKLGAAIMGIALIMAILRYVWRYLLFGISRRIEEGIRNRLYAHLQSLSLSFYHKTKTGDLMARAVNDINAIRMATGMGLVALTDGLVLGLAAIGFMVYINLQLTLISILPAPILVYFTRILTRRMSSGYEKVQAAFSDLTESARETFSGIRVVKAYTKEEWTYRRMKRDGERCISENMSLAKSIALFSPMMTIFTSLGLAIVIFLGGRLTLAGQITPGDFVAFISYLGLLTWPMMAIGWVTNMVQRGAASMRRLNRIFEEIPEIKDTGREPDGYKIQGKIEVKGVSMAYPGESRPAIQDIHLFIEAGKTVAFVGSVGSGKTTLLHMLPRLYDCPDGAIFIDDRNIRDIPLQTLRRNMGFVTQEVFVFSDTIRNNVLLGRADIGEQPVIEALMTAQLWEDVSALDRGMDTLLGERGISLSGGQRQRLSIARAVLTHPPILLLDDALSMVDTRTEERILNALLDSRSGKTTVMVSHRVSTISRANLIVVFDGGRWWKQGIMLPFWLQGRSTRGFIGASCLRRSWKSREGIMEGWNSGIMVRTFKLRE
jgi:ATP-binding cassette, subfamily B, multidrug efflux pump